nr:formin-2-like [Aegilops tauschii subsp. strangulata]
MAFTSLSAAASAVPPPAPFGAAPPPYGASAPYGASGVTHMQLALPMAGGHAPPAPSMASPGWCYPLPPPAPPQQQPTQGAGWAPHYPQDLPAGHQEFIGAPYQSTGAGYGALLVPPPLGGYDPPAPALPYGGLSPPPVPVPWDPALLAAQHSASLPSSPVGGGDWYMDSGATAHMTAHPVTNLVSVRRLTRENPLTVEFDGVGFSVKDARTRMGIFPSPSPSYEVEPGTPPATPATGSTSTSPLASSAAGSAGIAAAAAPAAAAAAAIPSAAAAPIAAPGAPAVVAPVAAASAGPASPSLGVTTRARAGVLRPSTRYSTDEYVCTASTSTPSPVPTSARAALRDPHLLAAMQEEFDALQRNRTWQLVPRPPRANIISGKWVFRHKTRPDGSLERYKA